MPERIQRKRIAGWRMPEGAVYVGRPTRWGNPYYVGRVGNMREWTGWHVGEVGNDWANHGTFVTELDAIKQAVEMYRLHTGPMGNYGLDVDEVRRELAGKPLCCWCSRDQPCHADVLLEIANATREPEEKP